jgi:hypothetical protein
VAGPSRSGSTGGGAPSELNPSVHGPDSRLALTGPLTVPDDYERRLNPTSRTALGTGLGLAARDPFSTAMVLLPELGVETHFVVSTVGPASETCRREAKLDRVRGLEHLHGRIPAHRLALRRRASVLVLAAQVRRRCGFTRP